MLQSPLAKHKPVYALQDHPVWGEIRDAFKPEEFNHPWKMDVEFLRLLYRARIEADVPFVLVSDYRTPTTNAGAGGAEKSAHMEAPCRCVDIQAKDSYVRFHIVQALIRVGFVRIGVYDDRASVHVDASVNLPSPRMWTRV